MDEYDKLRYLAVAIANCLTDGRTLDEIKRLCLFLQLIHVNVQSEVTCRSFVVVPVPGATTGTLAANTATPASNSKKP
jgi:hypothetical protein